MRYPNGSPKLEIRSVTLSKTDPGDDILDGGRQGWPAILSGLKSLLETGNPLAIGITLTDLTQ